MVAVPGATPVTTPLSEPIDAVEAVLLVHVPPVATSYNVVPEPTHKLAVPVIDAASGSGLTVTVKELCADPQPSLTV